MSFALTDFGITAIDTALVERFRLKKMVQVGTPVQTSGGEFSSNNTYGEEWEFSAEGKGPLPADFAIGGTGPTNGIDGLTGGITLVESTEESQQVGEEESWEASGSHAPAAT